MKNKVIMERKIGEIFEYNGEWYQCVEQPEKYDKTVCNLCDFHGIGNCELDRCSGTYRSDKKSVIFKKLEKVGEPYMAHDHSRNKDVVVQDYKLYNQHACYNGHEEMLSFGLYGRVGMVTIKSKEPIKRLNCENSVEIQIKEDMEEKKLNLKPFDLEAARSGKPVCTRDGRKARIICFDRRLFYKNVSYPILAVVERSDGEDDVCGYNEKGKVLIEDGAEYKDDLMMLPEKKEGWVNVYREESNNNERLIEQTTYNTRKDAFEHACPQGYITTTKINWEE